MLSQKPSKLLFVQLCAEYYDHGSCLHSQLNTPALHAEHMSLPISQLTCHMLSESNGKHSLATKLCGIAGWLALEPANGTSMGIRATLLSCIQEPSGVAAAVLSVQPFRYTTLLPSEGREAAEQSSKLVIRTELHLSGAADPNKRLRAFTTTFEISLSRSRHLEGLQGPSQAFSHTFLSQVGLFIDLTYVLD